MSETNEVTVNSYNAHVQEYIDGTPQEVSRAVKSWIEDSLDGLTSEARIIEFGSAFGRDAKYIEGLGYKVERTDVTQGFVDWLKQDGYEATQFNAITDELQGTYDLVFADAVLLHFTREETEQVIGKVHGALNDGGKFAFSLKRGDGEGWSEEKLGAPRFFCYWEKQGVEDLLRQAGYSEIAIRDDSTGHNNAKWLHVVAKK